MHYTPSLWQSPECMSLVVARYSVDVVLDKGVVNKDSLKDAKTRKKAKVEIRKKFEER